MELGEVCESWFRHYSPQKEKLGLLLLIRGTPRDPNRCIGKSLALIKGRESRKSIKVSVTYTSSIMKTNNILSVIPQVGFGKGGVYAALCLPCEGRVAISNKPSAHVYIQHTK